MLWGNSGALSAWWMCKGATVPLSQMIRVSDFVWRIPPVGEMKVPGIIYGDESLIAGMDQKVFEQVSNVARLPGIVRASYAMPDAHWGYGFPIGGVAAFDPENGGVISAGGVGFDISCGVRTMTTILTRADLDPLKQKRLADAIFETIPAGLGQHGKITLDDDGMDDMLVGGARWAVLSGWGLSQDLERIEGNGCAPGADPNAVSEKARARQRHEMGTLGSGNHYIEIQEVKEILDRRIAEEWRLRPGQILVSIHCGSRGLGHQIGTEFLKEMVARAPQHGIDLPDRELACAPISSDLGVRYLGAMRAGINCALANRQIITHLAREAFSVVFPSAQLNLLYDVSHNTCRDEIHRINGREHRLFVHRKGATRALGPGHPDLPSVFRHTGQPVLIGGSMGTGSYILAGTEEAEHLSFSSACHGAGRAMSRHQALRHWDGREIVDELGSRGIVIRSRSSRGVAEEAPGAYKNVDAVVSATERAGLARLVARLVPLICVKG